MQPVIKLADWKAALAKNEDPGVIQLRKQYVPDEICAVDGEARTLQFTISTGSVDRDNDTIDPNGWDLGNYAKNPVVMWAHDYRQPVIGRAPQTWSEGGALKSRAQFVTRDIWPFGDTIYQMLLHKFLRAVSVGFAPKEWTFAEDRGEGGWSRPTNFKRQELLEYSVCPIPSNPEALLEARSAGIDTEPLKQWAEEVLDTWHEEKGLWVPKAEWEKFHKAAEPEQKTVTVGSLSVVVDEPERKASDGELTVDKTAEVIAALIKQGRVLSAANEGKIRSAVASLSEVLSALETTADDGKAAPAPEPDPATETKSDTPLPGEANADDFDVTPAALAAMIRSEVRAALTATTGRLF